MIKIHLPNKNLGCLGFTIGKIYFDFYRTPCWGMFIRLTPYHAYWITRRVDGIVKIRRQR